MEKERRKFNRVDFDTNATLLINEKPIKCHLLDLSLHGALISLLEPAEPEMGADYQLNIPLDDDSSAITMMLKMVHREGEQLGLECNHIDLDSITHLRRVVELNLGNSDLLERDFVALIRSD